MPGHAPPRTRELPPVQEGSGLRARLRRFAVAWMLGAAVVVWPAWPTAAQERSARRPAFERALTWRDFIRLRLSPWLLMHETSTPSALDQPYPPGHLDQPPTLGDRDQPPPR